MERVGMPAVEFAPRAFPWEKIEWFNLQWAHRVGTVAFFALIGGIAAAMKDQGPYGNYLAAAAVIADVGLIGGIAGWWTMRRQGRRSAEPMGVIIFNLVILFLAVGIYSAGKFGYLTPSVQWLTNLLPAPQ